MKNTLQFVVLVAAGLLTPQPILASLAEETAPSVASARPTGPQTVAGASRSRVANGSIQSSGGETTEPGRAGGTGDPALGGERHPLYRLSKSDTIEVTFSYSPEFNQTVAVQPDGYASLRGAGSVLVEGHTLPELREAIRYAYAGVLRDPEITVTLKDFERPYFLASGEVGHPGKYEMRGDLTVGEAVAIAGGFTNQARHSQVVLFRRISPDLAETRLVDLKRMLKQKNLSEDIHLRPGDLVYVPQSRVAKIRRYMPASALNWYFNPLQF